MSLEKLAVEDFDYDFVSSSDSGDLELINDNPSEKVKAENKKCYNVTTTVKVTNFENDSVNNGTGVGPFVPSLKVLVEGSFALREGSIAPVAGVGTNKNPPPPTLPFVSPVEITDAKQTKVSGE